MNLPTRLLIVILLAVTASPVMAQRLIQASESGQESVDTSTFLNGTATIVGVSGIGSFTMEGSDVVIAGVLRDGVVAPTFCAPCTPGSSVSLRSTFGGAITSPLSTGTARFFNRTIGQTHEQVTTITEFIQDKIIQPARELAAIMAGFRRALEVLLAPSPKPINQTYGDEEMFIG